MNLVFHLNTNAKLIGADALSNRVKAKFSASKIKIKSRLTDNLSIILFVALLISCYTPIAQDINHKIQYRFSCVISWKIKEIKNKRLSFPVVVDIMNSHNEISISVEISVVNEYLKFLQ